MSNLEDNTDNKKLKALLKQSADSEALDDFDKEALEGYALLENEKEALDLKSKLDNKVYKEVFAEERKRKGIIWYAAAGLIVMIGFTVYFIRNNEITKSDLAINSDNKTENKEIQRNPEVLTEKEEEAAVEKLIEPQKEATMQRDEAKPQIQSIKELPLRKAEKTIGLASTDDMEVAAAAPANVQQAEPKMEGILHKQQESIALNAGTSSRGDEKNETEDEQGFAKASSAELKNLEEVSVAEVKKSKASGRKKEKADNYSAPSEYTGTERDKTTFTCYYEGGEGALSKDLKNSLDQKNIQQKFDAVLFINEKKKVEKVAYTNAYNLTETQQKQVIEILKQLTKFNFTITPKTQELVEYKLIFRP